MDFNLLMLTNFEVTTVTAMDSQELPAVMIVTCTLYQSISSSQCVSRKEALGSHYHKCSLINPLIPLFQAHTSTVIFTHLNALW